MLYLLRQRNFGLLWFGGLISYIGNWITLVALPVYIYTLTGSYLATGATWMAFMLPSVVLGSVAGVYVDRWDRRGAMLVTKLLDVPPTLALLFLPSAHPLWLVFLINPPRGTAGNLLKPAGGGALPQFGGRGAPA